MANKPSPEVRPPFRPPPVRGRCDCGRQNVVLDTSGRCKVCRHRAAPAPAAEPELVNHPPHYGGPGHPLEAIKVVEAYLGPAGFAAWLRGTIMCYQLRAALKNQELRDTEKVEWYNAVLIAHLKAHPELCDKGEPPTRPEHLTSAKR